MWQFYLPAAPVDALVLPGYPLRHIWFNGFIGQFGWLEYGFPHWVYDVALAMALGLVALVGRELIRVRRCFGPDWELVTYLPDGRAAGAGRRRSYIARIGGATGYEQPRYLLPAHGPVRRPDRDRSSRCRQALGAGVGVLLVCLAIAHSAAAMLLTLTRFYG